ncbi:hypothetical protein EV368DRAFT_81994 [Lentinula lateritia]|nr:hypothetical protein EV368DRAFT_81994 [Lentinula lateritia]
MKAFNHNRHSRPLSERINNLRFRPIASPPAIAVPVSPTEGRSDSSGDNKYYDSDFKLDIPRSKKASDRDAISKRVRFSINAFRLSSSSAPSSAKEHDGSFQSGFRRQRRVNSTASGTPGLGLLGILHSGQSDTPNGTNSITAADHSDFNAREGKVESSTKTNQLQSDPHTNTYVVVCSECERRDRGLYVPRTPTKATTQTNRQAAKEDELSRLDEDTIIMNSDNPGSIDPTVSAAFREEDPTELNSLSHDHEDSDNSPSHEVGHPIMQAYQTHPPVVHGPSSRTPSPMFQNIRGSRSARFDIVSDGDPSVSSKRQLTLQFVKGMFGAGRGGRSRSKTMLYLPSVASDTDDWQKLAHSNLRQGGLEEEAEGKLDNKFFYYIL